MYDQVRGDIEHTIEEILNRSIAFDPDIEWIFGFDPNIKSKVDFLLGYVLGRIYTQAWQIMIDKGLDTNQDFQELEEIIKRWIPEIRSRITIGLNI